MPGKGIRMVGRLFEDVELVKVISLSCSSFWGGFNGLGSGSWGWGSSLGDMARASRWQLVGINKESTVGVTGVQRQHAMVHVFLGAFGLVTGG